MKKFKKGILYMLKNFGTKTSKKRVKFDNLVLNLALQKIDSDSLKFDGKAVYSADMTILVYVFNTDDSFKIPAGVEVIGRMAFRRKKLLKNVTIPSSVKVIEKDAFSGCESIDNILIPATVESVKDSAFAGCDNLQKVTFAGELKHLSRYAFDDCSSLRTVIVPVGSDKTYRKALRIKDDNNDITVVEKVFSITPATKTDTAATIKKADAKKTVKAKPRAKGDREISVEEVQILHDELKALTIEERIEKFHLKDDRADVIVPAAEIFLMASQCLKADSILVPNISLADSIVDGLYDRLVNR